MYTAQSVGVMGTLPVRVVYEEQERDLLSLFIVQGKGPALFGWDWLASMKLRWQSIAYHSVGGMNLEELLQQLEKCLVRSSELHSPHQFTC